MRISDWSSDVCSSDLDLVLLYAIGALGFVMRLYSIPVAPAVIGLILGPLAEQQFRRALYISQGDATVFFTSPLSASLLAIAAIIVVGPIIWRLVRRSEEHTSELQSLMRISYAVFCLTQKQYTSHTRNPLIILHH